MDGISKKVGSWFQTSFWEDPWVGSIPFKIMFYRLFIIYDYLIGCERDMLVGRWDSYLRFQMKKVILRSWEIDCCKLPSSSSRSYIFLKWWSMGLEVCKGLPIIGVIYLSCLLNRFNSSYHSFSPVNLILSLIYGSWAPYKVIFFSWKILLNIFP